MNLQEQLNLLERVDQLIRLKATGSPKELAERLDMSERHLYRMIDEMKSLGFPIAYDKQKHGYYYEQSVRFSFEVCAIEDDGGRKINGGEKLFDFFSKLTDYGSEGLHLCDS